VGEERALVPGVERPQAVQCPIERDLHEVGGVGQAAGAARQAAVHPAPGDRQITPDPPGARGVRPAPEAGQHRRRGIEPGGVVAVLARGWGSWPGRMAGALALIWEPTTPECAHGADAALTPWERPACRIRARMPGCSGPHEESSMPRSPPCDLRPAIPALPP